VLHLAHDAEAARAVLSRALAAEMVGLLRAPDAQLAGAALRVVARLLEQPALPDLPGGAAGSWAGGAAGARIVEEEGGIDGLEHLVHPRPLEPLHPHPLMHPRPLRAASCTPARSAPRRVARAPLASGADRGGGGGGAQSFAAEVPAETAALAAKLVDRYYGEEALDR
jgi:hypothetical protein